MPQEHRKRLSLQDVKEAAETTLLRNGMHASLVIAEGSRQVISTHIERMADSHEARLNQMLVLGGLLAQTGEVGVLYQVFFITEAWLSLSVGQSVPIQPPSQDPQRREVLIVSQRVLQPIQTTIAMLEMKRDPTGKLLGVEDLDVDRQPATSRSMQSPLMDAFVLGFLSYRS